MASPVTKNTFKFNYSDDFNVRKGFQRILFNDDRNLQARELTQLQTIIQNQIGFMGAKLFGKDVNSQTISGVSKEDTPYIKLETGSDLSGIISALALSRNDPDNPNGEVTPITLTSNASNLKVNVIEAIAGTDEDPPTIYVSYGDNNSLENPNSQSSRIVDSGETLANPFGDDLIVQANEPTGEATIVKIASGEFYSEGEGFFIYADTQVKVLNKYDTFATGDIGFNIVREIVTHVDDSSLLDVSNVTGDISNPELNENPSSPGADRYRIKLVLAFRPFPEPSQRDALELDLGFVYLARIEAGLFTDQNKTIDGYSAITRDVLAPRTFDESGNYNVNQPIVSFEDMGDKLRLHYTDGIAYINGFRAQTDYGSFIDVDKPRENNIVVGNDTIGTGAYTNYVVVNTALGVPPLFTEIRMRTAHDFGGTDIGTVKIYAITKHSSTEYRFYLYDIRDEDGNKNSDVFRQAVSLGYAPPRSTPYNTNNEYADATIFKAMIATNPAQRADTTFSSLLYSFPNISRIQSLQDETLGDLDNTMRVQSIRTAIGVAGGGVTTITLNPRTDEVFTDPDKWLVGKNNFQINQRLSNNQPNINNDGTATMTITAEEDDLNFRILTYSTITNATPRIKDKVEVTITPRLSDQLDSSPAGSHTFDLGKIDIINIEEVLLPNGNPVSPENYSFHNGQSDFDYQNGTITITGLSESSTSSITIKFNHYNHRPGGVFFSVDSYVDTDYEDIPTYRKRDGDTVRLADVLDFRFSSGLSDTSHVIPVQNSAITTDIMYYSPNFGKLFMDSSGNIDAKFTSNIYPTVPDEALGLYNIKLNGYTLDANDVEIEKIETKLYKMSDFARLEDRIDSLEEFASLNALEQETANFIIPDDSNVNRLKSAFLADPFNSFVYSETEDENGRPNPQYRASLDLENNLLTPPQTIKNTKLYFNPADNPETQVVLRGDSVYLPYTEEVVISQLQASELSEKVVKFTSAEYLGEIQLSPSSDTWYDDERIPAEIVTQGDMTAPTTQAINWGQQKSNWEGNFIERSGQRLVTNVDGSTITTQSGNATIVSVVKNADRIVRTRAIPTMRNQLVYFRATGLKPNTAHYPFFNGVDVSRFVKTEDAFVRYGGMTSEYGNSHKHFNRHPGYAENDTPDTYFTSDSNGEITASFFIPNNDIIRFRTDATEFKLFDVSVNNAQASYSTARTAYTAQGYLNTRQAQVVHTRSVKALVVTKSVKVEDDDRTSYRKNSTLQDRKDDRENRNRPSPSEDTSGNQPNARGG